MTHCCIACSAPYIHFATNNRERLHSSPLCRCIHCMETFASSEIQSYIQDVEGPTAICPYCDVDAVVADDDWNAIRAYQITNCKCHNDENNKKDHDAELRMFAQQRLGIKVDDDALQIETVKRCLFLFWNANAF